MIDKISHPCRLRALGPYLCVALLVSVVPWQLGCSRTTANRLFPTASFLTSKGWKAIEAKNFVDASAAFEEALSRDEVESSVAASATLGLAYAKGEMGRHKEAIGLYRSIEDRLSKQQQILYRARKGLAQQYEEVGDFSSAEAALIRNFERSGDDREPSGDPNLMGNPFANFRHFAAFDLADFYFRRQRVILASAYLSAAKYSFPFQHFCGNALLTEEFRVALLQSKILEGLGQSEDAVRVLIPHVFERESNLGLDRELATRAGTLLGSQLDSKQTQDFVNQSLQSVRTVKGGMYPEYWVSLMGVDVGFVPDSLSKREIKQGAQPATLRSYLLNTVFFRALQGEPPPAEGASQGAP